jgi:hypothetical protein
MGEYKDRRNYEDHDMNNVTLVIDGTHKAEGLDSIRCELDEDEFTVSAVADGMAQFARNPKRTGQFVFTVLEASATNAKMWELWQDGGSFSISMTDRAVPNLDCKSQKTHIMKRVPIERNLEAPMSEWTCVCTYLDCLGGGFSLESA